MPNGITQYPCIVHHGINPPKALNSIFYDSCRTNRISDTRHIGMRLSTSDSDIIHRFLGRPSVAAFSALSDTRIIHNNGRSMCGT
jgi:hypothetical protein